MLSIAACDCTNTNSSSKDYCSLDDNSPIPIADGAPCGNSNYTITTSSAIIFFSETSVQPNECLQAVVSEISYLEFQTIVPPKLSTNLVPLKNQETFSIFNNQSSIIGSVVGKGIGIQVSDFALAVWLCLTVELSVSFTISVP